MYVLSAEEAVGLETINAHGVHSKKVTTLGVVSSVYDLEVCE